MFPLVRHFVLFELREEALEFGGEFPVELSLPQGGPPGTFGKNRHPGAAGIVARADQQNSLRQLDPGKDCARDMTE